ncbi:TPA: hypothetical protein U5E10_004245 [Yersinia enterocolitica]|uniref:hypothetical protein n=1 Tax=Yersinia TaxID=629 RepID=UPI0005DB1ECE|nr:MULTISPECIES: hypothetical protein [Yersinia]CNL27060.1 Uncharacterised protein [Yersinia frederiksenii]EKN3340289.1 hypothetical protein [Yersinia enterocolitica]EKN3834093.1 hypothetical protein [Yersinia enterocolitica]EKN4012750.1 hypothetical protein [Yersinia enterocolitica]ELI8046937.1 hypothetical protein [Yersinia enterocolitica]
MKSGLKVRVDKANGILAAFKSIGNKDVLVGIPESTSNREPEDGEKVTIGNAQIGYINEYGSPAQNIPARPHLQPGVQSVQDKTIAKLKQAAQAVFDGNSAAAEKALNQAGLIASDAVRRYMTITNLIPLADSTLAARARRGRKGAIRELARREGEGSLMEKNEQGQLISNTNARPLIDQGQYRRAITYIVRDKNAKS